MHRTARRVLITGVTGAAILGSGATALAMTGSATTGQPTTTAASSSASGPSATTPAKHNKGKAKGKGKLLRRAVSAQIVTKGKGGYVTHDIVRGEVTKVSAASITVKAVNGRSETYVVSKGTLVRARSNGKGAPSTISKVATGDRVLVAGTGTSTLTAKHIVDLGKKK